jgi:hypothetical protein
MLGFGHFHTHDTTATLHRWSGQWGVTHWSADNKILRKSHAVHDDFGNLREAPDSPLSPWEGMHLDDEMLADRRYHELPAPPQQPPSRVTVDVIQSEGNPTELHLGHDSAPFGVPLFRIDAGWDGDATITRGQLLALVSAAAPLLGLQLVEANTGEEH